MTSMPKVETREQWITRRILEDWQKDCEHRRDLLAQLAAIPADERQAMQGSWLLAVLNVVAGRVSHKAGLLNGRGCRVHDSEPVVPTGLEGEWCRDYEARIEVLADLQGSDKPYALLDGQRVLSRHPTLRAAKVAARKARKALGREGFVRILRPDGLTVQ